MEWVETLYIIISLLLLVLLHEVAVVVLWSSIYAVAMALRMLERDILSCMTDTSCRCKNSRVFQFAESYEKRERLSWSSNKSEVSLGY